MRKGLLRLGLLAGLFALIATSALAAPSVAIGSVSVSGGVATVDGTVSFPAISGAQSVGGFDTDLDPPEAGQAGGLDLVDAAIEPITGGLRFTWITSGMVLPAVPAEVVRYNWSFKIGNNQYQLQAKTSNLSSVTLLDDPTGHVTHAGASFQLRASCTPNYFGTPAPVPAVSGCPHVAWLSGNFDTANGVVTIDLPFGQSYASDFVSGATLVELQNAGMSITASFQAAVSNTLVSDYINGWNPYYVGSRVDLGVTDGLTSPDAATYTAGATVTGGTFSGTVGGVSGANDTVVARACNGAECAYASFDTAP